MHMASTQSTPPVHWYPDRTTRPTGRPGNPPARRIGTPIPGSRSNRESGIPCFPAKSGIGDSLPDSIDGHGSGGTSTPPHKKCAHGHARYGLYVQVLPRAGRTSTLCGASTRTACYSRRVTCRKTRSSEPSPVFLNTTLSRERPLTLATRPARQAPIRCPGARTRLRALYLNPSFPIYKVHEPTHRALFSPKSWGKHEPRPADNFIKSP